MLLITSLFLSGHRKSNCSSLLHSNLLHIVLKAISLVTFGLNIYFSFLFPTLTCYLPEFKFSFEKKLSQAYSGAIVTVTCGGPFLPHLTN